MEGHDLSGRDFSPLSSFKQGAPIHKLEPSTKGFVVSPAQSNMKNKPQPNSTVLPKNNSNAVNSARVGTKGPLNASKQPISQSARSKTPIKTNNLAARKKTPTKQSEPSGPKVVSRKLGAAKGKLNESSYSNVSGNRSISPLSSSRINGTPAYNKKNYSPAQSKLKRLNTCL